MVYQHGWHYQVAPDELLPFPEDVSDALEAQYQEWLPHRFNADRRINLHSGKYDYTIDFSRMEQTNTMTRKTRALVRAERTLYRELQERDVLIQQLQRNASGSIQPNEATRRHAQERQVQQLREELRQTDVHFRACQEESRNTQRRLQTEVAEQHRETAARERHTEQLRAELRQGDARLRACQEERSITVRRLETEVADQHREATAEKATMNAEKRRLQQALNSERASCEQQLRQAREANNARVIAQQQRDGFERERDQLRQQVENSSQPVWEYVNHRDQWQAMPSEQIAACEAHYQRWRQQGEPDVDVALSDIYSVRFTDMQQRSQRSGRLRNIRRVTGSSPGELQASRERTQALQQEMAAMQHSSKADCQRLIHEKNQLAHKMIEAEGRARQTEAHELQASMERMQALQQEMFAMQRASDAELSEYQRLICEKNQLARRMVEVEQQKQAAERIGQQEANEMRQQLAAHRHEALIRDQVNERRDEEHAQIRAQHDEAAEGIVELKHEFDAQISTNNAEIAQMHQSYRALEEHVSVEQQLCVQLRTEKLEIERHKEDAERRKHDAEESNAANISKMQRQKEQIKDLNDQVKNKKDELSRMNREAQDAKKSIGELQKELVQSRAQQPVKVAPAAAASLEVPAQGVGAECLTRWITLKMRQEGLQQALKNPPERAIDEDTHHVSVDDRVVQLMSSSARTRAEMGGLSPQMISVIADPTDAAARNEDYEIPCESADFKFIKQLVWQSLRQSRESYHSDVLCQKPQLSITSITLLAWPEGQLKRYRNFKKDIVRKAASSSKFPKGGLAETPISLDTIQPFAEKDANEVFLFHGCPEAALAGIVNEGFEPRRSGQKTGTMFGHGVYFAPNASKCLQYGEDLNFGASSEGQLLLARVLLGNSLPQWKRCTQQVSLPNGWDSIIAAPRSQGGCVDFPEAVIFNKNQALACFCIRYAHIDTCECYCCKRRRSPPNEA